MSIDELKSKPQISRTDIAELLRSIGEPGQKHDEKLAALEEIGRINKQGHSLALTAESYGEY
jgi:hypothetical protein